MMTARRTAILVVAAIVIAIAPISAAARIAAPPAWVTKAMTQLGKLTVKPAAPMAGYSRDKFGEPWADVDHNGCDTRNDILKRDLTKIAFKPGSACVVATGTLNDPYTGNVIHFVRGPASAAVQIDHVVALGDAWRTGAATWTAAKRLRYANDRVVLLAVDGPANQAKSDDDASEWLPPREAYDCRYIAKQITIKTKYMLWVTSAERAAMAATLQTCS
jgi:Protein of unknown function (DUF1524)